MAKQYFSVDRRGFYKAGGTLGLYKQNPAPAPLMTVGTHITPAILENHLLSLFPEGLSLHGWDYMTRQCLMPLPHAVGADYSVILEQVLEYVRRTAFAEHPSRLQSYFAFDSMADAVNFRASGGQPQNPIYLLNPSHALQMDQEWLRLGHQNAIGSYCAHQYWMGAASPAQDWEYMLVTPIDVVQQVA
ncbi:hypothetical protein LJR267_010722 [Paraburkholderia hospita]|uniref:hypothetical protein n=1 Tax=Paraburkholderia hospita TaxID=169430 RepID=UPI003ECFF047